MLVIQDTTDEDSDFEEGYRKKTKPIMLKIKKEKVKIFSDRISFSYFLFRLCVLLFNVSLFTVTVFTVFTVNVCSVLIVFVCTVFTVFGCTVIYNVRMYFTLLYPYVLFSTVSLCILFYFICMYRAQLYLQELFSTMSVSTVFYFVSM